MKNKKAYDQYGLRPSLTTTFIVRAKETCSMLKVDLKDVDQMVQPEYTPWITNMEVNIATTILALSKGSSSLRIRAELEKNPQRKLPELHPNIQGRIKNWGQNRVVSSYLRSFSIFNAEAEAINTAISIAKNTIQPKRGILSDLLSCPTALDGMRKIYNLKVVRMMEKLDKRETGRNKTSRMDIIWQPDGNSQTKN
jgi:hypothetical protein